MTFLRKILVPVSMTSDSPALGNRAAEVSAACRLGAECPEYPQVAAFRASARQASDRGDEASADSLE